MFLRTDKSKLIHDQYYLRGLFERFAQVTKSGVSIAASKVTAIDASSLIKVGPGRVVAVMSMAGKGAKLSLFDSSQPIANGVTGEPLPGTTAGVYLLGPYMVWSLTGATFTSGLQALLEGQATYAIQTLDS